MRILVTGGAGFIGSHLVEKLREDGHWVIALDRKPLWECYEHSGIMAGFDCRQLNPDDMAPYCFDFIYHLASTVGVRNVIEDPSECIDNIVNSTKAVLSLGIPGIYFSTSEIYGKGDGPSGEDSGIVLSRKARWAYAAAKMCGEWMALQAGWKVVRPFNVVGPRQNLQYGAVVPRFVRQALSGEAITVYGNGSQVRTFIDVRDFVSILTQVQDKDFDVLNLGGAVETDMNTLARLVKDHFHSSSEIVHVPYSEAYPEGFEECPSRIPDLSKLYSLIGKPEFRYFGHTLDSIAEDLQEKNHVRFETQAAQ